MRKLIPPFLFLMMIFFMLLIKRFYPGATLIHEPYTYVGIPIIILGFWMTRSITRRYNKVDTEIHTFRTPRKLLTDGLFSYSRNPIYLGFTVALIGMWLTLGSFSPLVGVIIFFLAANFWYIPFEEQMLEKEFGQAYLDYKEKVRRWI